MQYERYADDKLSQKYHQASPGSYTEVSAPDRLVGNTGRDCVANE